jgi:Icc-related predicted phosphoesterase
VTRCFFVSDLHGRVERYRRLFREIATHRPSGVFLGGDLLPPWALAYSVEEEVHTDFVHDFLAPGFEHLRDELGDDYPRVFVILGNDDPRSEEPSFLDADDRGSWTYAHDRNLPFVDHRVLGYSYIPPSPFTLKDWERYDVSRYVDPGCVSPEEGRRTVPVEDRETRYATIQSDLDRLAGSGSLERTVVVSHSPPYDTTLDRAPLDGKHVDHVPLDVHVGSIAIRRFIEARQPLVTLHGHVHESARLTGSWRDRIGRTHLFTAAHDGPELALVSFDLENLEGAERRLL